MGKSPERGYIFGWASNQIIFTECCKVLQSLKCFEENIFEIEQLLLCHYQHCTKLSGSKIGYISSTVCAQRSNNNCKEKGKENPIITRHYSSTHLEFFLPSCCSEHKSHIHCILSVRRKNCSQAKTFICKNVMGIIKAWLRNFPWKPVGSSTSSIAENYKENRL